MYPPEPQTNKRNESDRMHVDPHKEALEDAPDERGGGWDQLLEDSEALAARRYRQVAPERVCESLRLEGERSTRQPLHPLTGALTPEAVLKHYWGYDAFRLKQREIIDSVLAGRDTLGLLPTGGGKSITFQVPSLMQSGVTLIITPLIALMKDQVDNLNRRGLRADTIHSGLEYQEVLRVMDNCLYGGCKFLYISPERLSSTLFLEYLPALPITLIVVDECHCISQWGYDFRPSYLHIAEIRPYYPTVPILALTATATPTVAQDVMEQLKFRTPNVIASSFVRKNLQYIVRTTENKMVEMLHILEHTSGSTIIYCRNRERTQVLAKALQEAGFSTHYYHAGLSHTERTIKQNAWMSGDVRVMVCTNAFGMGIDKPDVRLVLHWSLPSSLEEYFQEAGRAGRDGERAYAVTLRYNRDAGVLRRRVEREFPERSFVRKVYDQLCSYLRIGIGEGAERSFDVDLEDFIREQRLPLQETMSAIRLLELAGAWQLNQDDSRSRLIMEVSREELYHLRGLTRLCEEVLQMVLRLYTGLFSDYVYINERTLATLLGRSHDEIYESLKELSKRKILHYIPQSHLPRLYLLHRRIECHHLLLPPMIYEERKASLEQRIKATCAYLDNEHECRQMILLRYFGELSAQPCGCCDVCLRRQNATPSAEPALVPLVERLRGMDWKTSPVRSLQDLAQELGVTLRQLLEAVDRLLELDEGYSSDGLSLHRD